MEGHAVFVEGMKLSLSCLLKLMGSICEGRTKLMRTMKGNQPAQRSDFVYKRPILSILICDPGHKPSQVVKSFLIKIS